jgi:hypothetical protein
MKAVKKFHLFWAWEDDKEEAWLQEMSRKGLHFRAISIPGSYTFEQGTPESFVYRLDYFTNRKDKACYLQLFSDAMRAFAMSAK